MGYSRRQCGKSESMGWVSKIMSRRIAIVEDEAAIRENYADVLRKQGYEVYTYANRKDAMSAFDIRLPNLAIIDIGLEDEIDGGFKLCQALRSLSDTLPIIFLNLLILMSWLWMSTLSSP